MGIPPFYVSNANFNEAIKNYLRDFYVYQFKNSREDLFKKNSQNPENQNLPIRGDVFRQERNRLMLFLQDNLEKNAGIQWKSEEQAGWVECVTITPQLITENPFYAIYQFMEGRWATNDALMAFLLLFFHQDNHSGATLKLSKEMNQAAPRDVEAGAARKLSQAASNETEADTSREVRVKLWGEDAYPNLMEEVNRHLFKQALDIANAKRKSKNDLNETAFKAKLTENKKFAQDAAVDAIDKVWKSIKAVENSGEGTDAWLSADCCRYLLMSGMSIKYDKDNKCYTRMQEQWLTEGELINAFVGFLQPEGIGERWVKKLITDFMSQGILQQDEDKRYRLSDCHLETLFDQGKDNLRGRFFAMLSFFSQTVTLGAIGNGILARNEKDKPDYLRYKHTYFQRILNDYNTIDLLYAIKNECWVRIEYRNASSNTKGYRTFIVYPLALRENATDGRQYVLYYSPLKRRVSALRIEFIDEIIVLERIKKQTQAKSEEKQGDKEQGGEAADEVEKKPEKSIVVGVPKDWKENDLEWAKKLISHTWGTGLSNERHGNFIEEPRLHNICVYIEYDKEMIKTRLERECRKLAKVEVTKDGKLKLTAELINPREFLRWLRSFIGRIHSVEVDGKVEAEFYQRVDSMQAQYSESEFRHVSDEGQTQHESRADESGGDSVSDELQSADKFQNKSEDKQKSKTADKSEEKSTDKCEADAEYLYLIPKSRQPHYWLVHRIYSKIFALRAELLARMLRSDVTDEVADEVFSQIERLLEQVKGTAVVGEDIAELKELLNKMRSKSSQMRSESSQIKLDALSSESPWGKWPDAAEKSRLAQEIGAFKEETSKFLKLFLESGKPIFQLVEGTKLDSVVDLMPLTNLEMQWLNNVLRDSRAKLFLTEEEIDRLQKKLFADDALITFDLRDMETQDQFLDINYGQKNRDEHMRKMLQAIQENRMVKVCYRSYRQCQKDSGKRGANNQRSKSIFVCCPVYVEYCSWSNRFRFLTVRNKRVSTLNLERICSVTILDEAFDREKCRNLLEKHNRNKKKQIEVYFNQERNVADRILTEFSCFEKRCIRWSKSQTKEKVGQVKLPYGEVEYQMTLSYHQYDTQEVVIRLLSYGELIYVGHDTGGVKEEMIERIHKQCKLFKAQEQADVIQTPAVAR